MSECNFFNSNPKLSDTNLAHQSNVSPGDIKSMPALPASNPNTDVTAQSTVKKEPLSLQVKIEIKIRKIIINFCLTLLF